MVKSQDGVTVAQDHGVWEDALAFCVEGSDFYMREAPGFAKAWPTDTF